MGQCELDIRYFSVLRFFFNRTESHKSAAAGLKSGQSNQKGNIGLHRGDHRDAEKNNQKISINFLWPPRRTGSP